MDRRGFFSELTAGAKNAQPVIATGRTQSGLSSGPIILAMNQPMLVMLT